MRTSAGGTVAEVELRRILLQDGGHRLGRRLADERGTPGEHLVEDRAEAEDVGPDIDGLAADLFRRHVARRADDHPALPSPSETPWVETTSSPGSVSLAMPKSRILTRPSLVMNRLSGFRSRWTMALVVRGGQTLGRLARVVDGLAHAAARRPCNRLRERFTFEQLRDDVRRAVVACRCRRPRGCWDG